MNIVGGAGYSTTYEDRIIQVTGGTIGYSISGGSNGVYATEEGSDGKIEHCNTLVYVGGNAQIGDSNNSGKTFYGVSAGCVLGAGNGNSKVENSGQVNNSHIIINDSAHIMNSVYGGGNYGIVGDPSYTTANAKIEILGGTIDGNVYGGANQNNIYGATTIDVKDGQVKGAVYGGSNTTGTVFTTSTINVTGGTLGTTSNTTSNPILFGGGYGQNTVITSNATVNIYDTNNNVTMYGSAYGGSSLGKINGDTIVNIKDLPTNPNTISITGYVFAGGKGTSTIAATIAGNSTMNVDGANLPEASVFGGNDINGETNGNITVNIGNTNTSVIKGVYGGGNQANITTNTDSVRVNLLSKADVTNAFNGGRAANLTSSSSSDTTRTIRLQGGKVTNLFGGSDTSGSVTVSNVYIESGNATNVFGGNNLGGTTTLSKVNVSGGTSENIYGGGYQATTTTTNVNLTGGNATNAFAGGNAANVTTGYISLNGSTVDNLYGGSNTSGVVTTTTVNVNSGTVIDVYGGNNAGGTTGTTTVTMNSGATNVYGGGNNARTTGNTNVNINNVNILGSVFGGGNGSNAVVEGNSTTKIQGTANIQGDVFGGGNAAANGTASSNGNTYVYITGATIGGDVYGGANTSVVNGQTYTKIGTAAVNDSSLTQGNIAISGTVFAGGKSNSAGSENYDFTFESVTGDVYIDIDAATYATNNKQFNIDGSIFGSGNAAKISGVGYIKILNYGTTSEPKRNISIQRAYEVIIDNSCMRLDGTTDRTNEISTALYAFNRIDNLKLKNNTTLYLSNGANIVSNFYSLDSGDNLETVTISDGRITRNVDNKIYLMQGRNLVLKDEQGNDGEVHGMTYAGIFKGTRNITEGIYDENYQEGDTVTLEDKEQFAKIAYVQGKHYSNHNIQTDGFYTHFDIESRIHTDYIEPKPENAVYYQWILGDAGDDLYFEDIELIATKFSTTGAYVLQLTGLEKPNLILELDSFDVSDLDESVAFVNPATIPNVALDGTENSKLGLTMSTGSVGWQSTGTAYFGTMDQNHATSYFVGTGQIQKDNSITTPSVTLLLGHSKNISTNSSLGTVTINLKAYYLDVEKDEYVEKDVHIVVTVGINNTSSIATDYYEGTMNPGLKYEMQPTTITNITDKSALSAYYSIFLGDYSDDPNHYDNYEGYRHVLKSSFSFPENTKITMLDKSGTTPKYYYYIVSASDEANNVTTYSLRDFIAMGSTNEHYNLDSSYYNSTLDLVYEEFIFQVDFKDADITSNLLSQSLIVELQDAQDYTRILTVNTDQYPMLYSIYSDKDAIADVTATMDKDIIYVGEQVVINAETTFEHQVIDAVTVFDSGNFENAQGIRISLLDGTETLNASEVLGIYYTIDNKNYYPLADGSVRLKVADTVANVNKKIVMHTENSTIESGSYILKIEMFASNDGIYFNTPLAVWTHGIQIVSTQYGLSVGIDENSVIIDKETGNTENGNNNLEFVVGYSGEFTNPKLYVEFYRRSYEQVYSMNYILTCLQDYVTTSLITTNKTNRYLITDTPEEIQNFNLKLKNGLKTGTYRFKFILYDGDVFIGEVDKQIVIK